MRLQSFPRLMLLVALLAPPVGLTALAASLPPAGAPTEASLGLSARNLARQIHEDGAEATARALDAHRSWPQLRRAVAAGWDGWIALVPDLITHVDDPTASRLRTALRQALPRNPHAVLSVIDPGNGPLLGAGALCTPHGMSARWRTNSIRAISAVHDIHLAHQSADCLAALAPASGTTGKADSGT
ncbi:hypothetical protein ACOZ4Y_09240 [Komagataeibacter rhaeticus]|uniref:hypothetical protein n=1 Tax=Komagataeibacter rhaeticus TaxID=215221 RepID=UPI0004D4EEED|nr:hypothetical protein [Komagataeibacter rhaeticus]KDU97608.1 hypothetical protein GLUCORHAEAF1_16635 [Komagataeibacter rhaeticus AF1]GBQ12593.1 hypothetical protein AA16663_1227 [Komagataeibacter rhaeticus DSM 16663]